MKKTSLRIPAVPFPFQPILMVNLVGVAVCSDFPLHLCIAHDVRQMVAYTGKDIIVVDICGHSAALKSNVSSLVHACYFSPILLELDELDWF